jgi:MFS transporter, ACS family, hexuronate transporter
MPNSDSNGEPSAPTINGTDPATHHATALSPWRWAVCALLLLATTLNYMDRVALNQLSVRISAAFHLSNTDYGQMESVFSIAFAIGTLATGWLVDRKGVRWIYPIAVAGWSLSGFATGFVDSFGLMLVCRFSLGFFEAGNWPCGIRTIRQVMPPEQRSFGNSLFQSGTAIGAIVTPFVILLCLRWFDANDPKIWRWPFLIIGSLGIVWIVGWLILPSSVLKTETSTTSSHPAASYWAIFRDHRFYLLIAVILGVNYSWHTLRIWMPKYFMTSLGDSEETMQRFSIAYYLLADIGAWTVGLATWGLSRWLMPLHTARLITFGVCTAIVLSSLMIPFLNHRDSIAVVILITGFGALGLFPTYFALSQDLSAAHQGKVTGTLGFINAIAMAGMSYGQGWIIDSTKRFDIILATAGLPALVAFAVTSIFWRRS